MTSRVRVLHVIDTLDVGGAENVLVSIINNLSDIFQPTVCCLDHSGPVARKITRPGVEVLELHRKPGNDYSIPFRLAGLLRERRIDVVHSHDWGTYCESMAAALLARTPVRVHMVHGRINAAERPALAERAKRALRRNVERILSGAVDRIIAVSDQGKDEIVQGKGIAEARVSLIRNGIDLSAYVAKDTERKTRQINLRSCEFLIASVGRLAPVKDWPSLIEALARLHQRAPDRFKAILVGGGPEQAGLEALIRARELDRRIFLLGEQGDVREWLSLADVFVLPSLYEGISIALLEAMSMGMPAVATRVGGNPEVIADGESGLLVPAQDPDALAEAIFTLANDEPLRQRMGRAARRTVERDYDLNETIRKYEEIYLQSLQERNP